jgi:2-iminobutanoate/2-iminopropanoate deaminase
MSSGISGIDAATGKLVEGAAEQARCAFENMRSLVVNGGGCLEDVLRLTVHVRDDSMREHVNTHWLAFFPDPEDRPARHIVVHAPQGQALLQLEVVALVQERTPAGHAGDAR